MEDSKNKKIIDAKSKIIVCIVSPGAYPLLMKECNVKSSGGAEAQLVTLGKEFSNRGVNVNFIVDDFGQPDKISIDNIEIYKIPIRYLSGRKYCIFNDWVNIIKCLNKIKADVHLLKIPKDLILPIGIYSKISKSKVVLIGQSDKDVDIKLLYKLQNKFAVFLYRLGLNFVDIVVAQNNYQKIGFDKFKIPCKIIKNILTFPDSNTNFETKNYILWVGNSTENKQPEMFLEIADKLPQFHFKMIMAPSIQKPDDAVYKNFANCKENFEYLGFVPFYKIEKYFIEAALLVSTSLIEGFPNTFLQAWQCGTPVVSMNIDPDGIIEKYQMGKCSKSIKSMCYDINIIMNNHEMREKMKNNGKRYVMENHSISLIVDEYIQLFSSVYN